MPIYHKLDARSFEWFAIRLGKPSASEFHKIVTPKGKLSTQAEGYMHTLLAELMIGHPLESPETAWMTRGTDLEDSAITAYEFEMGIETEPGGFITNDEGTYGCSPDRLVGECGDLEMKCPAPNTHVGYLLEPESLAADKKPQVQGRLMIHGRDWVDLMSFHPDFPHVIVRVERDEKYIEFLRKAMETFVAEIRGARGFLESRYGKFPEIKLNPDAEECPEFDVTEADVEAMIRNGAIQF